MSNKKNDTNTIVYSIVGAGLIGYFMPTLTPYLIFGGGLLGSVYKIVDIISKSEYCNNNYIEKEDIDYFRK